VSHDEAQRELDYALADVARGTWEPSKPAPPSPSEAPLFGDFADEWWKRRKGQITPKTQQDYRWRLEVHLLHAFENTPIDAITCDTVERYIAAKLADGLSPRSVNMLVGLMGTILEGAVERELITRNLPRGRPGESASGRHSAPICPLRGRFGRCSMRRANWTPPRRPGLGRTPPGGPSCRP